MELKILYTETYLFCLGFQTVLKMDAGRVKGDKVQLTLIYLFLELNIVYIELIFLSWSAGDDDGRQSRARRQGEFNRYFSNQTSCTQEIILLFRVLQIMKMDAGRVEADKVSLHDVWFEKYRLHRNLFCSFVFCR